MSNLLALRKLLHALGLMICVLIISNQAMAASMQQQLAKESTIEQILQRGTIRVGMDVFVPWAMKNKKGELIGFEIDVAKQLAADMDVNIEFVPTKWSGIIPALIAGKFDVIIGGMMASPKRNMKINFTRPYYYTTQGLLANKEKTKGFSLDDFNSRSVTLAARLGSTAALAAKERFPKAKLRLFDDEPAAVQEVRNGNVHGMVGGNPLPVHMAAESPEILVAYPDTLLQEPISFGIRKGDVDTLNFFNNWIEMTNGKGWIKNRYHYWFETEDWKGEIR